MTAGTAASLPAWWRWLRWPVAVAACGAVAGLCWQHTFGFSASANDWLAALGGTGGAAYGVIGKSMRGVALRIGVSDLGAAAAWMQLGLATLHLILLVAVGRLVGLGERAFALPLLALATGGMRDGLATFGPELLLGTFSLATCVAVSGFERFPRLSAVLLGAICYAVALAHPIGFVALPALLVVAGMLPRPALPAPAVQALAARPVWLPWVAAVTLCVGLLLLTLPGDRIKEFWDATMRMLRVTTAAPRAGGIADLPLIGGPVAVLIQLPMPLVIVGAVGGWRALRRRGHTPIAVVAGLLAGWLVVVAAVDRPLPAPLAMAHIVAPLMLLLAATELSLWQRLLSSAAAPRPLQALLVLSFLVACAADSGAGPGDRRSAVAVHSSWQTDPSAGRPARIDAATISVLRPHIDTTSILPASEGGNALARRLTKLRVLPEGAVYVRPFAAKQVLVREPFDNPLSVAWATGRHRIDCDATGTACLYRLKKQKGDAAPAQPKAPPPARGKLRRGR